MQQLMGFILMICGINLLAEASVFVNGEFSGMMLAIDVVGGILFLVGFVLANEKEGNL